MRRATTVALALCSLAALAVWGWPEKRIILGAMPESARSGGPIQWEAVEGMQVLKLWKLEKAEAWPQIDVLKVSNADYQKFSQNPKALMEIVNKNRFFSKDVIKAGPWVTLSSVEQDDDTDEWILTVEHGKMSTMIVSALPKLTLEKERKK